MKKLFLLIFSCSISLFSIAQNVWKQNNVSWNYDINPSNTQSNTFKAGDKRKYNPETPTAYSVSVTSQVGAAGFMPKTPSGIVRAQIGGEEPLGIFKIGTNELEMPIAAPGMPINKLSFYNISEASPVMALKFTLDLTKTPVTTPIGGGIFLVIGNNTGSSNIYTNNGNLLGTKAPEYFAAFQFLFSNANTVTLRTRQFTGEATTPSYKNLLGTTFKNGGGPYNIEVYANNWTSAKTYLRGATEYVLPEGVLHFWVNDIRLSLNNSFDIPKSGDALAVGNGLNAFTFNVAKQGVGTVYEDEKIKLRSISVNYVDNSTLPIK